jgi:effector-binding domain-containing protein
VTRSDYRVSIETVRPRPIAAVRARMPIDRVPMQFAQHLNRVYDASRKGDISVDGQNIFVYRGTTDDVEIEFGVGTTKRFPPIGAVTYSETPGGIVATTVHWGEYSALGDAYAAVVSWCKEQGRVLAGPRWEVYGHWNDDPAQRRTDIYMLLID